MTDEEIDPLLLKADRYSKIIALFVAGGVFGATILLTIDHEMFKLTVAGVAGIGSRIYIPYHASAFMLATEENELREMEATGNYNHGAVGAGLMVGVVVAIAVMVVESSYWIAMSAGAVAGVAVYVAFNAVFE